MQIISLIIRLLSKPFIHIWLFVYGVKNYTINKNNTVDVNGNVYLSFSNFLFFIPIQFNQINGSFSICYSVLFSLRGCPKIIKENFSCNHTYIRSLKGGPEFVKGKYECNHNDFLTSLKGSPSNVGGDFVAYWCNLKSLNHVPLKVGKNIYLSGARVSYEHAVDFFNNFKGYFGGELSYSNNHPKLEFLNLFYEDSNLLSVTKKDLCSIILNNKLMNEITCVKKETSKRVKI